MTSGSYSNCLIALYGNVIAIYLAVISSFDCLPLSFATFVFTFLIVELLFPGVFVYTLEFLDEINNVNEKSSE